jgi:hypothetical protein
MEAVAGNLAEVGGSDGVAFDYDLDGHEDFVACDGKKISFFRNLGSGDWKRQEGVLEDASSLGDGLSLGDCNSDRLIDLLLWRPDESERQDMDHAGVAPRSKSFVILLNQGDGTFLRREVGVREMRGDFESIGSVLEAGVP